MTHWNQDSIKLLGLKTELDSTCQSLIKYVEKVRNQSPIIYVEKRENPQGLDDQIQTQRNISDSRRTKAHQEGHWYHHL